MLNAQWEHDGPGQCQRNSSRFSKTYAVQRVRRVEYGDLTLLRNDQDITATKNASITTHQSECVLIIASWYLFIHYPNEGHFHFGRLIPSEHI